MGERGNSPNFHGNDIGLVQVSVTLCQHISRCPKQSSENRFGLDLISKEKTWQILSYMWN